ncbi:MAG: hypothetical protein EHM33_07695 [Chloroflexi bacterium]|nr:MAG: hypothetical protein EHM33_07695 [Chloroflexota bacterium]
MLGRYLLTLVRTLTIEGGVAYLLGLCKSRYKLTVVMVNLITHPVLGYLLLVLGYLGMDVTLGVVIILEILVVIVEWQLLVYVYGSPGRHFFIISLLANATSFLVGILLFWV